jgi:hypothetical protein
MVHISLVVTTRTESSAMGRLNEGDDSSTVPSFPSQGALGGRRHRPGPHARDDRHPRSLRRGPPQRRRRAGEKELACLRSASGHTQGEAYHMAQGAGVPVSLAGTASATARPPERPAWRRRRLTRSATPAHPAPSSTLRLRGISKGPPVPPHAVCTHARTHRTRAEYPRVVSRR